MGICCTREDFRVLVALEVVVVGVVKVLVAMVLVVVAVLGRVLMVVSVSVSLATTADRGLGSSGTCRKVGLGDLSSSALGVGPCVGGRGASCWI